MSQVTEQEVKNAVFWEARMGANRKYNQELATGRRVGTFATHTGPALENQRYYDSVLERAIEGGLLTKQEFWERVRLLLPMVHPTPT